MFGLEKFTEIFESPIEKVQKAISTVLFKEIRKNRMSNIRENMINQPTFVGIAKDLAVIVEDEEDPVPATKPKLEQMMASLTVFADQGDGTKKPMVFFDEEWIKVLSHAQLVELVEGVFMQNLTSESNNTVEVISEDMSSLIKLHYGTKEVTAAEAATSEEDSEESTSTDECKMPEPGGDSEDSDDDDDDDDDGSKTTEDTMATFTKMKEDMSGDIKNFVSHDHVKQRNKDISRIQEVQDILEDGMRFQGRGKSKTAVPSKRLNMKTIITESSDNEYIGKRQGGGKKVKIMLTIDRSGSMHGQPTTESNVLMSALNNIVLDNPELEAEVMLSYTGKFTKFKLPVGSKFSQEIWNLTQTGDAEYLWQNMQNNMDSLTNADINLVYTDGSICDDAIDKTFLDRRDVNITGLYVSSKMGVDNLKQHYSRNKMYFHHVVVRPTVQELAEEISSKIFSERSTR